MDDIEQARLKQLERCIPDIWTGFLERHFDEGMILYIGAYPERFHFYNRIRKANIPMDIIEIERKNCNWLESKKGVENVYCCDIRTYIKLFYIYFETLASKSNIIIYDSIIWSHGVEIIPIEEGIFVIKNLEKLVRRLIIHMTPYGDAGGGGMFQYGIPKTLRIWDTKQIHLAMREKSIQIF